VLAGGPRPRALLPHGEHTVSSCPEGEWRWIYCYRAVDEEGQVVDTYVSERRNAAAQAFFRRAITETDVRPQRE